MAHFTAKVGVNFNALVGTAEAADSTQLAFTEMKPESFVATVGSIRYFLDAVGFTFVYLGGKPYGGTVEHITVFKSGIEQYIVKTELPVRSFEDFADVEGFFGGPDTINGSGDRDVLRGFAENDTINGNGGHDDLYGDTGVDTINGGEGNDHIDGGSNIDNLNGGNGIDTLDYSESDAVVIANLHTQRATFLGISGIEIIANFERVIGSNLSDHIFGNVLENVIFGGRGADKLYAKANFDEAEGDTLRGEAGADTLLGDRGNDSLHGGSEGDKINGEEGSDAIFGEGGKDILFGGDGNDEIRGGADKDEIVPEDGVDSVYGDAGNDDIFITSITRGESRNERVDGGSGFDALDFRRFNRQFDIDLGARFNGLEVSGGAKVTVVSIEHVIGNRFSGEMTGSGEDEALRGEDGSDMLKGMGGSDTLDGGDDDDFLIGGAGGDLLEGGGGRDYYIYNKAADTTVGRARDEIEDFRRSEGDKIHLRNIDANTSSAGNDKFKFIGSDDFHGTASKRVFAELRQEGHIVQGDVNGDGRADFEIDVNVRGLRATDFVL